MECIFIHTRDPLYAEECRLRGEILRKPLGLKPDEIFFPFEDESLHLVVLKEGQLIGCVLFHPEGETGRLYQMAIAESYQRQGLGSRLVQTLETRLRDEGFQEIYLHARDVAADFYKRLGYRISGDPFTEVGITHYHMVKQLRKAS